VGLSIALLLGCGDDGDDAAAPDPTAPAIAASGDRSDALASGDVGAVVDALSQGHGIARTMIGPHQLSVSVELALTPVGEPATTEAEVGKPRPVADAVRDEIRLVWASAPGTPPRFSLAQHNDHDHGRDIVVADERMYTRHEHRGWYVQPLQVDVWELWLDDAQHALSDVVALAAPRLQVQASTRSGGGLAGGDALALQLALASASDPARVVGSVDPLRAWRKDAEITAITGEVVVDAKSGLWLAADVHVGYTIPGPDGRELRGDAHVKGSVTPLQPDTATIEVPADVAPILERTRYEVERTRLLDGLAGR
jgi:hypothetical protein